MYNQNKFIEILQKCQGELSLNEFAKKAKVDSGYLSRIINKKKATPPTPSILQKIADSFPLITDYNYLMQICGYLKESPSNNIVHIAQRVFDENINLLDKYHLSADQIIEIQKILIERNEKDSPIENQINSFVEVTTIEDFEKDLSIKDFYNDLISINNRIVNILDRYEKADYEYPIPLYNKINVKNYFIDFENSEFNKYINLNINLQKMNELIFYFALVISDNSMAPLLDVGDIAIIHEVSKKTIDDNDIGGTYLLQVDNGTPIIRKLVKIYGENGFELHSLNNWNYPIQKNIEYNRINILGKIIRAENKSAFN